MKNIKQICFQTIADLYENDREFVVRITKGEEQVMLFSKDSMNVGRCVLNFVTILQNERVISYAIDVDSSIDPDTPDTYNIVIKLAR